MKITILFLVLLATGACAIHPAPPVAPCVYFVHSPAAGANYTGDQFFAAHDLAIDGNTVTFTNCYTGEKTTIHGAFTVEAIR
jgi:hypothetical protein